MNTCTSVRALRSSSGDVHVARVVVSLVVHAVVGLTLGLIARVVVVVFVVTFFRSQFSVFGDILFTHPVGDSKLRWLLPNFHCNFCIELILRIIPRIIGPITVFAGFLDRSVLGPSSR